MVEVVDQAVVDFVRKNDQIVFLRQASDFQECFARGDRAGGVARDNPAGWLSCAG